MNIAIDGPAGAGKSTIAKRVSKELSYIYVDTGAMYRALATGFLDAGLSPDDEAGISAHVTQDHVSIQYADGEQHVYLNGTDVTGRLRTEEVGNMASSSSVYPAVRAKLLDLQRSLAKEYDVVMDGRDIGTVILPDAEVKIYLTASVEERALRRYKELTEKGISCDIEKIKTDIAERDHRDMTRATSPLKQADDAHYLDSSDMTIDEVVAAIIALARDAESVN